MEGLSATSRSPEQSLELGRWLGERVMPGGLLLLDGELGAGKTLFTKGVAAGLGIDPDRVTSPSFTLVQVHQGRLTLFHVDLYRLEEPHEVEDLGLEEFRESGGLVVVEWASRLPSSLMPEAGLWIRIEVRPEGERTFRFRALGAEMETLLDQMAAWVEQVSG